MAIFSWNPFQLHFQLEEQPKIIRSHVWREENLTNQRNIVFDNESWNQMRRMGVCIVMIMLTSSICPQSYTKLNIANQCFSPPHLNIWLKSYFVILSLCHINHVMLSSLFALHIVICMAHLICTERFSIP